MNLQHVLLITIIVIGNAFYSTPSTFAQETQNNSTLQKTISISPPPRSLQECEQVFLRNNLILLAEQFSIEAADARTIQASLWENPLVSIEFNALNPQDNRAFDIGADGQKAFAIQQLIYLGGKKSNEIELAKTNAAIARLQFQDLLRTLKYQLRTGYFALYYDQIVLRSVTQQLVQLDTLITAYAAQAAKGNLPYKDLVRLQSLYLALQNNRTALHTNVIEEQKKLKTLLSTTIDIAPVPLPAETELYQKSLPFSIDSLQALALGNRPDVALAAALVRAAETNLALQQSVAVPDVIVGANYDQRGGAFLNQVNLTLGVTLPLWNRNQGNIGIASAELSKTKGFNTAQTIDVRNQVAWAYQKYQEALRNIRSIRPDTEQNFEAVYTGMLQNFQRRNVTILEFTDFIESYTSSIVQIAAIRKNLTEACEDLNLATAVTIF
jgi:cobalt-zinc-cadmium efflux system outer membrane protein